MDPAVGPELRQQLTRLGAAIVLGTLKADTAVSVALSLVATGTQSDAALELAAMPSDPKRLSIFEVEPLARLMLTELGMTIPSPSEAGWITVRFIAEAMIGGVIEPPTGALRLWGLWHECGGEPDDELTWMLQLHDAWEATVGAERDAVEVEMLQYAPKVIAAADLRLAH